MTNSTAALPAGHLLNEYKITRLLGVGGFGLTYLANDENLNLPVAVKEYLPAGIATREADFGVLPGVGDDRATFDWGLSRFLDEARTLATFRHPNIVRVMRFFQANKTAYMVMEFVHGAPLNEWVKARRPITQQQILDLIVPLVEGLAIIHRAGFVHRDVKPGNIYIRQDGSPVLLDFGAARTTTGGSGMTAVVSPGYAPVEQYSESSAQGPYSDLYAVGGVMYWLITGQKPVDATARLKNDPQPRAVAVGDRNLYTEELLAAIDWALNPDEQLRPQDCPAFLDRLRGAAGAYSAADVTRTVQLATRTVPLSQMAQVAQEREQPGSAPLDSAQLKEVENELAQRIGPLASVLVRKAAKRHTSMEGLIAALADDIDNEADRASFTQRAKGITQPPSSSRLNAGNTQIATQMAASRFDIEVLERAERRLAQHIGAVARVFVKKAAMKARDEGELYLIMADEIADPNDRKAFIKKAIAVSGKP